MKAPGWTRTASRTQAGWPDPGWRPSGISSPRGSPSCRRIRAAGVEIRRSAWKNLVFTGGPGAGKSRVAAAVARVYRDLGLLSLGQVGASATMARDRTSASGPPGAMTLTAQMIASAGCALTMLASLSAAA